MNETRHVVGETITFNMYLIQLFMESDDKKDKIWIRGWSPLFNQLSYVVLYAEADEYDDSMQANALSVSRKHEAALLLH
jgi:hypothetical protein